jgi:hypothetical protein
VIRMSTWQTSLLSRSIGLKQSHGRKRFYFN